MSKIYVNADYADKEEGVIDGDKVYGSNAFGSLLEAVDAQTADTSEIVIESDISEALSGKTVSGKITADKAVTVTDSDNSNYVNLNGIEIGKNVTVDAKYFYLYGENTIDGTVKSSISYIISAGSPTLRPPIAYPGKFISTNFSAHSALKSLYIFP